MRCEPRLYSVDFSQLGLVIVGSAVDWLFLFLNVEFAYTMGVRFAMICSAGSNLVVMSTNRLIAVI